MDARFRRPRLVGRDRELTLLREALSAARTGIPATVTIGGDTGAGRTRLLQELLTGLPADVLALSGGCYDGQDPPVPFAPLLDALRALPAADTAVHDPALLSRSRTEVFTQVLAALEHAGRERTTVLALEDLHLADRSTLDLVTFLVANLRATRTLLVVTWCSERVPGGADLRRYVAELTEAGAARVDLAPLRRADLAAVLADASGGRLDAAVEAAYWERAEGNPFFALELLAAADDDPAPGRLPDTLADLMLARLEPLGCRARQVVRVAGAAGRRVEHRLLAAVTGMPADELFAALHEAVDHQVLEPTADGQGYRFRHALLQEAVGAQLLPGERRHLLGRHADVVPRPRTGPAGAPEPLAPRLTPRELQVLALVASGHSNRTIAEELFISEKTASVHVSNILAKLGARSRTAAAAEAHRLGVLR